MSTIPSDDFDPFAGPELERVVPTTQAQREIWVAHQYGQGGALGYNQLLALRLEGRLDVAAMAAALDGVVARHEALRATLSADGASMLVARTMSATVRATDLTTLDARARDAALAARLHEAAGTEFDLVDGPLFRAELIALDAEVRVLLLAAHHVVCDGLSMHVIVGDIARLYAAALGGQDGPAPVPAGFSQFVLAQDEHRSGPAHARDLQWWTSRLADSPPPLDLPADSPHPRERDLASHREDHLLDAALVADLERAARDLGLTFAGLMLGAAAIWLSRLSGQAEVVVGVPVSERAALGLDDVVGHCVGLLPVRLRLDPEATAGGTLRQAQDALHEAVEHPGCTLGELLVAAGIRRDPGVPPLVSATFNLERETRLPAMPGLSVRTLPVPRRYDHFEWTLNAAPHDGGLRIECQHAAALFDPRTVRHWLASLEVLLRGIAADGATPVNRLPALDDGQRALLARWNDTATPFDRSLRIHDLVEAQAARTPEAIALAHRGRSVTYRELLGRADRLAGALRAAGVGPGDRIGLCVARGVALVVAQLAVLKAGGAYVPLDPAFPAERLRFMADDAAVAVMLSQPALQATVPVAQACWLLIDEEGETVPSSMPPPDGHAAAPAVVAREAGPEDPAYVIYTSGSTGKPKGVVVQHRGVVNFLLSMAREPGLCERDIVLATATLAFDISVLELLLPLSVGARIVMADREQTTDGDQLRELIVSSGATLVQATPTGFRLLVEAGWSGQPGVRGLVGGEPLPADLARRLLDGGVELWNVYGPTETTVWCSAWRVERPEDGIRIGHPIENMTIRALDAQGQPCPIGVSGELWIGGEGVTAGYWRRDELNRERFLPDPFDPRPGARIYRTGDRGRWCSDGQLEHLGRLDFQVKVRGYRIELGEIEAALGEHPSVGHAVVVVREDRPGELALAAYVAGRTGAPPEGAAGLRTHLRRTLPEYMVPRHIVAMAALPMLPNGKVDRKSLPAPVADEPRTEAEDEAPRTDAERLIARVWADVLGVEGVARHDNFFDLGGDSLLAMQALNRIAKAGGGRLRPQQMVVETLAQLAASLGAATPAPASASGGLLGRLLGGWRGRSV